MLEFLVDNIFVVFSGKVFQQIVGIPMGTNCAPLLADIFLYSYEAEFIQSLFSAGKKRLASQFNFTYRYIDDVLSINNPDFENYLGQMYPPELEIKDTTESNTSASYLDLLLSIGRDGQLHTSLYDIRDDFNFHITNFPFLSSNIPSSPAYGVFISQLIRYARACSSYECFILRAMRLSNKLLGQGYVKERLKSSLRKFYGRYGDLTKQYEVPLSRMLHDILDDDHIQWHPPLVGHYTNFWPLLIWTLLPNLTFYLIVQGLHRTYATGAACQQRTLYSSGHLVLSHFGTCMCSNVETNLSWTCLVSGLLSFEHPSVLLFCSRPRKVSTLLEKPFFHFWLGILHASKIKGTDQTVYYTIPYLLGLLVKNHPKGEHIPWFSAYCLPPNAMLWKTVQKAKLKPICNVLS